MNRPKWKPFTVRIARISELRRIAVFQNEYNGSANRRLTDHQRRIARAGKSSAGLGWPGDVRPAASELRLVAGQAKRAET